MGIKTHQAKCQKEPNKNRWQVTSNTSRNLVLLRDHPEGCNKIQDNYKSESFVIIGHHKDPNVDIIQPLDKKGPKKVVNR